MTKKFSETEDYKDKKDGRDAEVKAAEKERTSHLAAQEKKKAESKANALRGKKEVAEGTPTRKKAPTK